METRVEGHRHGLGKQCERLRELPKANRVYTGYKDRLNGVQRGFVRARQRSQSQIEVEPLRARAIAVIWVRAHARVVDVS